MAESNNKKDIPESDKVIDFTVIKLKQLITYYKDKQLFDVVLNVEHALDNYLQGKCHVKWHDGLPYCKAITALDKPAE